MKALVLFMFLVSSALLAQGPLPPEVTPRTSSVKVEKTTVSECPPVESAKEVLEGKCLCEKPACPEAAPVVKTVVKYKTKTITKTVDKVKYVDRPVEKIVERIVSKDSEYKKWNITLFYGKGPEGFDRVLNRKDGGDYPEYTMYRNYGDLYIGTLSYRFTESWNVSGLYIFPNDTRAAGVGYSF